ncbi:MAG: hypothetical protein ACP5RD_07135, partial [bacterium]
MNKTSWELKNYFLIDFYFIFILIFFNYGLILTNFYKFIFDLLILIIFYIIRIKLYAIYNKKFDLNFFLIYVIFISIFNNLNYTFLLINLS